MDVCFCFDHMFILVERSRYGSCGIYSFILPVDYRLTELHIVDLFDNNKNLKRKSILNTMFFMIAKAIFKLYKCSYVRQEEVFLLFLDEDIQYFPVFSETVGGKCLRVGIN